MDAVEFQAKIENGAIAVPEEYKQELTDGDAVKVIVVKRSKRIPQTGILAELARDPVQIKGLRLMSRDELYKRSHE
jgi:hypothetical protein